MCCEAMSVRRRGRRRSKLGGGRGPEGGRGVGRSILCHGGTLERWAWPSYGGYLVLWPRRIILTAIMGILWARPRAAGATPYYLGRDYYNETVLGGRAHRFNNLWWAAFVPLFCSRFPRLLGLGLGIMMAKGWAGSSLGLLVLYVTMAIGPRSWGCVVAAVFLDGFATHLVHVRDRSWLAFDVEHRERHVSRYPYGENHDRRKDESNAETEAGTADLGRPLLPTRDKIDHGHNASMEGGELDARKALIARIDPVLESTYYGDAGRDRSVMMSQKYH